MRCTSRHPPSGLLPFASMVMSLLFSYSCAAYYELMKKLLIFFCAQLNVRSGDRAGGKTTEAHSVMHVQTGHGCKRCPIPYLPPFFYADNFRPVFSITLLLSLLSYSLSPTLSLSLSLPVCLSVSRSAPIDR